MLCKAHYIAPFCLNYLLFSIYCIVIYYSVWIVLSYYYYSKINKNGMGTDSIHHTDHLMQHNTLSAPLKKKAVMPHIDNI